MQCEPVRVSLQRWNYLLPRFIFKLRNRAISLHDVPSSASTFSRVTSPSHSPALTDARNGGIAAIKIQNGVYTKPILVETVLAGETSTKFQSRYPCFRASPVPWHVLVQFVPPTLIGCRNSEWQPHNWKRQPSTEVAENMGANGLWNFAATSMILDVASTSAGRCGANLGFERRPL